jgi:hypothetical protein
MALGCNGIQVFARGVRHFGQTAFLSTIASPLQSNVSQTNRIRNLTAGEGITSELVGLPSGYRHPATWMMPQKGGALAARYTMTATISGTGTAVGGITADAPASITFTVADAAGQLISSGEGTASLTFAAADALLTASLAAVGETAFTISTNTPELGAEVSATATASLTFSATMTPYALGIMTGTTEVATDVVNANIVSVNGYSVTGNGQSGSEWGPA